MFWDSFSEDQWNPSDDRDVLIIAVSPAFYRDRQRLSEFALRKKIASMFGLREWVQAGSLLSYGVSFTAIFRRAADYVDRIAKGVKAADLPKKAHANAPGD
jgi:putative ABC transport system substrate-binding protein